MSLAAVTLSSGGGVCLLASRAELASGVAGTQEAVKLYSKAITLDPTVANFYSNRVCCDGVVAEAGVQRAVFRVAVYALWVQSEGVAF